MRLLIPSILIFFVLAVPLFSETHKYNYKLKVIVAPNYRLISYSISKYEWDEKEKFKVKEDKFSDSQKRLKSYNFKYKDKRLILKTENDGIAKPIKLTQYYYRFGKLIKKVEEDKKLNSILAINVNQHYYKDNILNHQEIIPIKNGLLTKKTLYTYSLHQTRVDHTRNTKIGLKESFSRDYTEIHHYKTNGKLNITVKLDGMDSPISYTKYFYDNKYRISKAEVYKVSEWLSTWDRKNFSFPRNVRSLIKIIYYHYSDSYPDISKRVVMSSKHPKYYIYLDKLKLKPKKKIKPVKLKPKKKIKPVKLKPKKKIKPVKLKPKKKIKPVKLKPKKDIKPVKLKPKKDIKPIQKKDYRIGDYQKRWYEY